MNCITNGNDYKRGWEDGHRAALAGKEKSYSRMANSWKFIFHDDLATKTYSEGYDKGYEEGLREAHVTQSVKVADSDSSIYVKKPNSMETHNSTNVQSLLTEIGALKGVNTVLVECVHDLVRMDKQFRSYINSLSDTGVQQEVCDEFVEKYYKEDAQNFKSIVSNIMRRDLPMMQKYRESLVAQFQTVSGIDPGDFRFQSPDPSVASAMPHQFNARKGGPQDYVVQLDACCDLMDFLVEQRNRMVMRRDLYRSLCQGLESEGVPKQVAQHYEVNFAKPNIDLLNKTIKHVEEVDYPHVRDIYRTIMNALVALDNPTYYHRSPKFM